MVIVGQAGLTDAVLAEADGALGHHELIKMRINAGDRVERRAMIDRIVDRLGCECVNSIGHIALFYRRHPDKPRILLPAARKPAG